MTGSPCSDQSRKYSAGRYRPTNGICCSVTHAHPGQRERLVEHRDQPIGGPVAAVGAEREQDRLRRPGAGRVGVAGRRRSWSRRRARAARPGWPDRRVPAAAARPRSTRRARRRRPPPAGSGSPARRRPRRPCSASGTIGGLPSGNGSPTQRPVRRRPASAPTRSSGRRRTPRGRAASRRSAEVPVAQRAGARQPGPDVGARAAPARRRGRARPATDRPRPRAAAAARGTRDEAGAEDRRQRLRRELDHRSAASRFGRAPASSRVSASAIRCPASAISASSRPACSSAVSSRRPVGRAADAEARSSCGRIGAVTAASASAARARWRAPAARRRRAPGRSALSPAVLGRASDIGHVKRAAGQQQARAAARRAPRSAPAATGRRRGRAERVAQPRGERAAVDAVAVGVVEHVECGEAGVGERRRGRRRPAAIASGSPSAPCAHVSRPRLGLRARRVGAPAGRGGGQRRRERGSRRDAGSGTPVRGVRTTSGSGGTASPAPSASSAAAARAGLPRHELVHRLGEQQVGDRVVRLLELLDRRQHRFCLAGPRLGPACRRRRCSAVSSGPSSSFGHGSSRERSPSARRPSTTSEAARLSCTGWPGSVSLPPRSGASDPQHVDEAVELEPSAARPLVQPALEPIAEQRAERLAAPHAVEQRRARRATRVLDRSMSSASLFGSPRRWVSRPLRRTPAVAAWVSPGAWTKPPSRRRAARRGRRSDPPRPARAARCSRATRTRR